MKRPPSALTPGGHYQQRRERRVIRNPSHTSTSDASPEKVGDATIPGRSPGPSGLGSPRAATSVRHLPTAETVAGFLDEGHRRNLLEPVRRRWERRATELNGAVMDRELGVAVDPDAEPIESLRRRRAYAVARCKRLRADVMPRVAECGTEHLPIACRCGLVGATVSCRQFWLCSTCRAKRTPALGSNIRRGLDRALSAEVEQWGREGGKGQRPQLILLTFTTKHSGNIGADHDAIATGWRKLYKRMHEEHGWFPYAGVWEVTPGWDGLGHVHLHVAAIWRYRDWKRIKAQWRRACPTSMVVDIAPRRKDKKDSTPASVANYLGKYLSKGADTSGFSPRMRAEISAGFYNQRAVITSERFWVKQPKCCPKCHDRYRLVEIELPTLAYRLPNIVLSLVFHGLEPPSND